MFRSVLGALVFAGFVLLAAFRMVGTEDDAGQLATAALELEQEQQRIASSRSQQPAPDQFDPIDDFYDEPASAGDWGLPIRPYSEQTVR